MVGRRHKAGQVVLQRLRQRRVKGQVRPDNVLLNPHVRPQPFDLLPQTVEIFLLRVGMVRLEDAQRVVVDLLSALDVAFQAAQHTVQLALLFLVELPADPGKGGEDCVGKPITSYLRK